MALEVKIPAAGESINTATVGQWHKADGETVAKGEVLATIETDKVSSEVEAPIDGIKISDLNSSNKTKKKLKKNNKFSYYIKVADFYYKKSAKNMSNKIKSEVKLKNIKIIELTKTNYRLLLGPFNDIQSLKDSFEKMNSLYFENLEIIKDA